MLIHNCPSTGKGKKLEVPQGKEDKLKQCRVEDNKPDKSERPN